MSVLAYVRMVLWSFFGIRRNAAAGEELAKARPLVLASIAVALAASFVLGLLGLATLMARTPT